MKTTNFGMMIGAVGFLAGVAAGVVGVGIIGGGGGGDETVSVPLEERRILQESAPAESQVAEPGPAMAESENPVAESEAEGDGVERKVLEAMMEMGAEQGRVKGRKQVERLTERLGLNEGQATMVGEAFEERQQRQQGAGIRMMQGKATVAELAASDDAYFVEFDAAVKALLTDDQLAEFAVFQEEREGKRIERKADEEVGGLASVADLSDEQRSAAWEILAGITAEEPPEAVPEGTTLSEFEGFLDESLEKRKDRLEPVLEPAQMEAYEMQLEGFREMLTKLIAAGTASPEGK